MQPESRIIELGLSCWGRRQESPLASGTPPAPVGFRTGSPRSARTRPSPRACAGAEVNRTNLAHRDSRYRPDQRLDQALDTAAADGRSSNTVLNRGLNPRRGQDIIEVGIGDTDPTGVIHSGAISAHTVWTLRTQACKGRQHPFSKERTMKDILHKLWTDEEGATVVEYVLLVAVLALGLIVAMTTLKGGITNKYGTTSTAVESAN